jgi:hypothetical protein
MERMVIEANYYYKVSRYKSQIHILSAADPGSWWPSKWTGVGLVVWKCAHNWGPGRWQTRKICWQLTWLMKSLVSLLEIEIQHATECSAGWNENLDTTFTRCKEETPIVKNTCNQCDFAAAIKINWCPYFIITSQEWFLWWGFKFAAGYKVTPSDPVCGFHYFHWHAPKYKRPWLGVSYNRLLLAFWMSLKFVVWNLGTAS